MSRKRTKTKGISVKITDYFNGLINSIQEILNYSDRSKGVREAIAEYNACHFYEEGRPLSCINQRYIEYGLKTISQEELEIIVYKRKARWFKRVGLLKRFQVF